MRSTMRNALRILAAVAAIASTSSAFAQTPNITGNEFQTQTPGKTVPGMQLMCLNGSNQAVPCTSAAGLPITIPDGADVTLGAKGDAACGTATGMCSLEALIKYLNTTAGSSIPAGNAGNGGASGNIGAVAQYGAPWAVGVQYGATALVADPCQSNAASYLPFSFSGSGTTRIVANAGGKKIYICHIHVVPATANNISLVEGATSCGTPVGMAGGNTAATGWNFQLGGGIALGNGAMSVAATATAGNDVCLITSVATQVSGVAKVVQQ